MAINTPRSMHFNGHAACQRRSGPVTGPDTGLTAAQLKLLLMGDCGDQINGLSGKNRNWRRLNLARRHEL